jgi:hypothetical protein
VTGQSIDQITLLGDIGATNARFALLTAGVLGPVKWIEVARYSKFVHAIEDFLQSQFFQSPVSSAVLAVAGPVEGQRGHFTNSSWSIDGPEIQNRFKFGAVRLVNDFEATALSLPHLMEQDVRTLGGGQALAGAPMVVLGPGSGLGVSALVGDGPRQIVIASEGAATQLFQQPRLTRMQSSYTCGIGLAMFQLNGYYQGRESRTCIMRSRRSMELMRYRAMRPTSLTLRCRGLVRRHVPRSICFAPC